ncbi:MAG: 3-phosphoshikimate 1-carboxyvinyltransferase [Candidatus Omnitrophota bacterium]|nr:3-phosphoshikimate 1-carboxyvinyltransferase [Candidatus Omnitrophota bacterium]
MTSCKLAGPGVLTGTVHPPGDKSISHRALMISALAEGESSYSRFLEAADCLHTMTALQALGVDIKNTPGTGLVTVRGVGMNGLKAPEKELYLGNSGTSMRLLLGVLAGQRFECQLTGDESLSTRPMRRVTQPLKQMGAQIKGSDQANYAPLTIRGGKLKGISFDNHLASAQVKSAILFAGMYADGKTRVVEPVTSRDHTERFLEAAGVDILREAGWVEIGRVDRLTALGGAIPGDISSAAFFIAGAAVIVGSELTVKDVCLNPTRTGLLNVLRRMGAHITTEITQEAPEPMGNIYVVGRRLKGTRIAKEEVPSLIDELPILMTAMAAAEGESLITGADELRVKETDRIHSMSQNLNAIGGCVEELPDGCLIRGVSEFRPGKVDSFGDHRTAMSMAIASRLIKGELEITGTACIGTSYPRFFKDFEDLQK